MARYPAKPYEEKDTAGIAEDISSILLLTKAVSADRGRLSMVPLERRGQVECRFQNNFKKERFDAPTMQRIQFGLWPGTKTRNGSTLAP